MTAEMTVAMPVQLVVSNIMVSSCLTLPGFFLEHFKNKGRVVHQKRGEMRQLLTEVEYRKLGKCLLRICAPTERTIVPRKAKGCTASAKASFRVSTILGYVVFVHFE